MNLVAYEYIASQTLRESFGPTDPRLAPSPSPSTLQETIVPATSLSTSQAIQTPIINPANSFLLLEADSSPAPSMIQRRGGHGVLILSEFAGAADSLYGAIVVNPYDPGEVIDALFEALTMDAEKRALMHRRLEAYVEEYTSEWWGNSFVDDLKAC
jgi:hypothetical protein